MPAIKRVKTKYAGVYYIEGSSATRKKEKVFYIMYRKNGKLIEEKAGRQFADDMTPARASGIRAQRIEGKQKSNAEQREKKKIKVVTVQTLADEYFSLKAPGKAKDVDLGRYNKYLMVPFGSKEPKAIIKLDTDRLRINLLKKLSPQTVKHILALLKRLINFGSDRGLCQGISFKITLPLVDNIKTEDLSPEEIQRLFEVMDTTIYKTAANMMKLALFTGMRRGEMFKLRWEDIDLHRGFIHIREPKGGRSQKIPINNNTEDLLKVISRSDDEYVFPARGGGPRKSIARDVRAIKEEAGLPADFRPLHGLRHLYATMLASSGKVDMYTLQKLLTHKSPQMTQRYAHYRDEAMRRASDQVDDILSEAMQVNKKITAIK